jgi:drug/metabolite transporter superfamily protein YnfA
LGIHLTGYDALLFPLLLFAVGALFGSSAPSSNTDKQPSRHELLHKLSSKIGFHRWRKRSSNAGNKLRGERYISLWHKKQMNIFCCMIKNLIFAVAAAALSRTSSSLITLIGVAASTIFIIWSLWWFHQLEVKYFCQYTLGGDGYKQRIMSMLCVRRESLAILSGFRRAQTMQIFI